ncbi:hypothetical protein KZX46_20860 [Polymorphobacter sp. PAMC 29334]|uniref:hypothetical protein n=1 Tax=Polymorphobacter sp. PAMC 29334 TaxID=2862331 RepID=UPI001C74C0E2|nr:hypothetical protein [Polymorphobacter sp. PAMC 29334]QYE35130.1 hypothetical protein KZX46_20860 [Polymorphobacter sp. PAMC 29334]
MPAVSRPRKRRPARRIERHRARLWILHGRFFYVRKGPTMLSLHDPASTDDALRSPIDPTLRALLTARVASLQTNGLADMTHFLVVQPGDTEAMIVDEIGFSPLVNVFDGIRCGVDGFHPFWDWLRDVGGWFEMIVAVGNGGFAFVLLIQDADGVDAELLNLCRTHAE